ncbi:DUF2585 family protein [Sinorhizobium meliloti]|uniref:DUF2585 family protein n=1 Tax=Rhizobium meliloti TaxID=382 RepID=UPI0026C05909
MDWYSYTHILHGFGFYALLWLIAPRGYFGDSVLNSLSDTIVTGFGFALARILPVWASILVVVGTELFLGFMIRDNLTLNILQLIHPSEVISRWQLSG